MCKKEVCGGGVGGGCCCGCGGDARNAERERLILEEDFLESPSWSIEGVGLKRAIIFSLKDFFRFGTRGGGSGGSIGALCGVLCGVGN